MGQPGGQPPATTTPAREALWQYRGVDEDASEEAFYTGLAPEVRAAISVRLQPGERVRVGREMLLQIQDYTVQARLVNLLPVTANVVAPTTTIFTQYQARKPDEGQDVSAFIAEVIHYPNPRMGQIYASLVGLDAIQQDMFRKLTLLLQPGTMGTWAQNAYGARPPQELTQIIADRYPLVILEGQVGSGKTALARSIGHVLATSLNNMELALVVMNAQLRGGGHVGELTKNIARAFGEATRLHEHEQLPVMILIDEADSLAQARGGRQTHHEDDAGVNALIQCIDKLRGKPMAVVFATNLAQTLDAAIVRRAVATYHFDRPSEEQRTQVFTRVLHGLLFSREDIARMVNATAARPLPGYGSPPHRYTYSDITQRIIPGAIEEAIWAREPLSALMVLRACNAILPTPEAPTHLE
ncbi:MAG TPA: AAA family ATPase [Ktedonobacterales bacterium]|nr:AAA family ATPase [Ktedonobacterales bacterium]